MYAPFAPGDKQLLIQHTLPASLKSFRIPLGEGADTVQVVAEEEGLVLPRRAVFEENGKFYVQPVNGVKTEVQVRGRNAVACLVEGLAEGTEVRT